MTNSSKTTFQPSFIVASDVMRKFMGMVERVARHTGNVLIIGETGTGKERIAHTIHEHSQRCDQPFVDINCAALPEHLVESELFGYEKGAFSGANAPKAGLFEMAQEGTLFLDEIGELDLKVQVKLLRVLDRSPYYRLGGSRKITADVRVVAATNRNLKQEVAAGRFRQDLYHRLSQFELCVPPLRERREDIAALASHLLAQSEVPLQLSPDALQLLRSYPWPGNVRELQNVMNKVMFAASGVEISAAEVASELTNADPVQADPLHPSRHDFQEASYDARHESRPDAAFDTHLSFAAIQKALASTRGHRGHAAAQLGISRRTLSRKLRDLGLSTPRPGAPSLGSLSDEERQHYRAEMKVLVSLTTAEGQEINCTASNLGVSGMGLEGVTTLVGPRADLRVRFQFPDSDRPVETLARLAWADKQGAAGIIFTQVNPATRREINRWLHQKMAEEGWSVPTDPTEALTSKFLPVSSYTN